MSDLATLAIKVDSTGVTAASKHLDDLEGKSRKVETATQSVSSAFDKLKGVVVAMAASYAAMKLVDYIKDATLMAARYETLGVVIKVVGNNAGYSAAQMETFANGLEKTGISMVEARNTLIRMTQAQLDLTKSSELARVAQDAAVIGNTNSSEAFQRLVYGIQSAQTEILRTIGINVNFEKSYQDVAKATGRTVASFTEAEKSQIRMNAVMESGIMIAGAYEASMQTAGKQMNSLQRHIDNMKTSLGLAFTPALTEIIETITGAVVDLNGELSASKEAIKDWGNEFRLTIIDIEIKFQSLSIIIGKMRQALYSVNLLLSGPGRALGSESATRNFNYAADQIIKLQEEEKALDVLIKKYRDLEYAMTPEGKAKAQKEILASEEKILQIRGEAAKKAAEEARIENERAEAAKLLEDAAKKAAEEAKKLHEEWIKFEQNLDKNDKLSGLSGLTRDLVENQIAADEALKRFEKLPPALRKEAEARILASKATADATARQKEENEANEDYIELIKQIAAESKMLREAEIEDALFLLDIEVIRGARYNSTMQERLRLSEEFLAIQKSILEKTDSSDVTAYRAQTKAVQDAMKQVIELQKQISDTSPGEGMMRGINSIIDEYENLGSALESTVVKGIKGMEDALVDFVKTGKLEFKDLANAIIADMIRIMVQQSMLSVMQGASGIGGFLSGILGGLGGAAGSAPVGSFDPSMFSNVAHSGGVIGHGGGVYGIYDSSLFDNAPRLHNGLMPDEFPAILQRGERVIPKNQTGGGGAGGDAEIVTNNITINAVDAKSFFDMCKQNPDAIFGPIMSRLKNNKNRTEMKRALT